MGLGGIIQTGFESLGLNGSDVKPINEGVPVTVVESVKPSGGGDDFWGFLDDLGTTVKNGVGDYAREKMQSEIDRLRFGSEARPDSTGDPDDQAGQNFKTTSDNPSFVKKYQKELVLGGVGLVALVVVVKLL